jgi:hypothetical protein
VLWSDNESTEDLLGFQYLAVAVVSIVKNENLLPATIGVFGDWGGGKSTLIEIRTQLTSEEEKKAGTVVLSFSRATKGLRRLSWEPSWKNFKNTRLSRTRRAARPTRFSRVCSAHFAGPAGPALLIGGAADVSVAREVAKKVEDV